MSTSDTENFIFGKKNTLSRPCKIILDKRKDMLFPYIMDMIQPKYAIIIASAAFILGGIGGYTLSSFTSSPKEAPAKAASAKQTTEASKAPKKGYSNKYEKAEAAKGIAAIHKLPNIARDALICSRFGLLFTSDGSLAYSPDEDFSADEKVQYYGVAGTAQFVDREGKTWEYFQALRERDKTENHAPDWITAMQAIGSSSDEDVFEPFQSELIALAQQSAKYHLDKLSTEQRAAWLAEQSNSLFTENNKPLYTGRILRNRIPGTHTECTAHELNRDAVFVDAKGQKQRFMPLYRQVDSDLRARAAWRHASNIATMVGAEYILELYASETKAIRKAYRAATK